MTTMPEAAASSAATQSEDIILEVKNLKMHRLWIPVPKTGGICEGR